jgi:uncharacterized protein YodC (DUF2158 family)
MKPGEIVKLKTATRSMVVLSNDGQTVVCSWYNASQEVRGEFPIHSLELVPTITFLETPRTLSGRTFIE